MAMGPGKAAALGAAGASLVLASIGGLSWVVRDLDTTTPSIAALAEGDDGGGGDGGAAVSADLDRAESADAATTSMMAEDDEPYGFALHDPECAAMLESVWGPTESDLAEMREENQRIIAVLEEAGVAYEVVSEPGGWEHVQPADDDWQAFEEALESYWQDQEEQGLPAAHREEMLREADELAALFEAEGVEYERIEEEDGWVHVEPTDEAGYEVMERYWQEREAADLRERAEEKGMDVAAVEACVAAERAYWELEELTSMFPFPNDERLVADQREMVDQLVARFAEAGIAHEVVDVPIVEWDVTDEAAADIVREVAREHGYAWDEEMEMATEDAG